ncbi:hypothetical protein FNV43_RR20902 [Rhamnella rubrinervis]|uniref:Uncharacterized protein n=1 Tax=Rhamnella rubrinervis TaxID=2594499 RepID=A0A8K0GUL8_9ROSA|nr:hypothetical protein FNV43_RR20902 [Rhamnella rubrinervis]
MAWELGVCGHPWCDNVGGFCRRSAANGGRRRNSKNSATVEFSQRESPAFWDPRDDGWQCSTEHGTGSHRYIGVGLRPGLNVLGVAAGCWPRWCYAACSGVGIILTFEAPYGWSLCRACDMHCFQDVLPNQILGNGRDTAMNLHPSQRWVLGWGACGLGFENSSVLLGNLSGGCGINGGSA